MTVRPGRPVSGQANDDYPTGTARARVEFPPQVRQALPVRATTVKNCASAAGSRDA
jgi:hypothetical protein